jgi:3-oxoacyl-[acyl-carrier-protein] synthase-1
MVRIIADNILSPLGKTTEDNLLAVRDYRTRLQKHHLWEIPEPFVASLFNDGEGVRATYEELIGDSILASLEDCDLEGRVVLVLSSTKGQTTGPLGALFGESANRIIRRISVYLPKVKSITAFTVSNACISGLAAQIIAQRLLEMGAYDYAIVSGCDVQNRFIVSGFQSFKAMSPTECRPFDEDRNGLNLGDAAATIIFKRCSAADAEAKEWVAMPGFMRNDAFHISGPSRTAEGSYRALAAAKQQITDPVCISAHGTATLYNDDMESKAIDRAGMNDVPVSALKGYYGHTMGAAGILESIITMHAIEEGWIPGTRGYKALGTSRPITVIGRHQKLAENFQHPAFIKLMSGFGGCNAAMPFHLGPVEVPSVNEVTLVKEHTVHITPTSVTLDGENIEVEASMDKPLLTTLYKTQVNDYPKFYKMDILSKLGFLATELLLKKENATETFDESRAVLLFGRTASHVADSSFEETIQPGENYFPSPADFVYTLPNIVMGEIAIRNGYHGETCYFALSERDEQLMQQLVSQAFVDTTTTSAICGWLNADDNEHFEADIAIVKSIIK